MRLDEYLAEVAVQEVINLQPRTQFYIRDLFRKTVWEIVPLETRKLAGLRFYEKISKLNPMPVKDLGKLGDAELYEKV